MFPKEYFQIFMTLISIQEILTFSALDEDYMKDFIKSRKLREAGFNDFNLTSVLDTSLLDELSISIDAASVHRRQRSAEKLDHYDVVINGFGESYRMTLKHTTSVLHPSATILTIDDDGETQWQGEHPNCFLIGDVHSHSGSVSASFCNELAGIMATDEHELYFEVLPHHIRRRSTIKLLKHTALLARKKQNRSKLATLKLENDYVDIDEEDTNVHKRRKRSVPSTSFTIEIAVYCDADYMTNHLHLTSTSDRVTAMVVKYNAVAFEWGRSDVLGYNITLSLKRLTFYDTNPSWYNTSTNLEVPLRSICAGTENGLAYDHVHLHTGVKNPSLGGVAFQSRVCNVHVRCGVSSDGITTYVTTAHELGHNMGMKHDSDQGCTSPNVGVMGGAGVGWSTCSINDMDAMLKTGSHNCLWEDNILDNEIDPVDLKTITLEADLPGQSLTNDEICEKLYGSGFHYREYPHLVQTICNKYSCVDLNTNQNSVKTYGRMYKQSRSITGSYCADNKICYDGSCRPWSAAKLTNPEVRAGAWSGWGSWTTCSRTCGRGMIFRKRKCDNPTPKNHAPCEGNEHDAEGCNVTPCAGDSPKDSELIKQRATETCAYLINNNIINGTCYTTKGEIFSSFKHGVCEVECTAVEGTIPSDTRFGLIEHGTPCPGTLDNPDSHNYPRRLGFYWACLEGYCLKFDCANTLNSRVYDGCGVCNGNNDTCVIRTGTMSDAIAIWTRTEMMTIPVGAYNIEMSFVWGNNRKYYIEIYTKEGAKIIASSSTVGDPARIFETGDNPVSYGGTLWHFEYVTQIMYAKGPLDTPVVAKIYNYESDVANTGVHYFYSVPLNIDSCTGTCENGGAWNVNSCACDCQSGFTGTHCGSRCRSSTLCKNGASRNESTCECMCNEKQYGSTCDCRYPFKGGNCDTCKYYICENGGTFNPTTCRCECSVGYGGLKCEANCADITDSDTCATQAATGNCTSDNVNMEQNCMISCDLCEIPVNCSDAQMKCSVDNKCISLSNKCNGVEDCSDGSDESCSWLNSTGNSFQAIYGTIIAATIIWLLKSLLEY